ncbi:ROK family protein [Nocardioides sp.]|uniref:ROK family protein n=1 Tax=Nocardioides sp. TaxID=35761 RepID=UPI0035277575
MQSAPQAVNDTRDRTYAVLDIGGTWTRAALWHEGRLGPVLREPTPRDGVVGALARSIRELGGSPARVGVSATGPVDPVHGRLGRVPNAAWLSDLDLRGGLAAELGLDVVVDRDTNAALLAEHAFGAGRGCGHAVYLTLSTGVGGAVLEQGRLLRGHRGLAGELGHLVVQEGGPECGCGRRGCLEALASGDGLARRATAHAEAHPGSTLGRRLATVRSREGRALTGRDVADVAEDESGDGPATRLLDAARTAFATAVVNVVNGWDPERVIVGGSIARAFPAWLAEAGRRVAEEGLVPPHGPLVVAAELGGDAELLGAGMSADS